MDRSAGVRMNFWRVARLLGILIVGLICVSCGDQYRPVAIPITPPQPDPQAIHFVLVFSVNGAIDPGASSRLDVSGDTNIGVARLGLGPAHATLTSTSARVYAVNTLEDSVSSYSPNAGIDGHDRNHNFPSRWFATDICSYPGKRHGLCGELRKQYGRSHLSYDQRGPEPVDCGGQPASRSGGNPRSEKALCSESGRWHGERHQSGGPDGNPDYRHWKHSGVGGGAIRQCKGLCVE